MTDHHALPVLEAELQRLTTRALSPLAQYGHVALLLVSSLMCILLAALLATEPMLPMRTQMALTVMLGIGAGWVTYAVWVLRNRRPLMARHRVIAGRMAVAFTALFFIGAAGMALNTGAVVFQMATAMAGGLVALAVVALRTARAEVARLEARRQQLERELGMR
jgi:hypothetical protein